MNSQDYIKIINPRTRQAQQMKKQYKCSAKGCKYISTSRCNFIRHKSMHSRCLKIKCHKDIQCIFCNWVGKSGSLRKHLNLNHKETLGVPLSHLRNSNTVYLCLEKRMFEVKNDIQIFSHQNKQILANLKPRFHDNDADSTSQQVQHQVKQKLYSFRLQIEEQNYLQWKKKR